MVFLFNIIILFIIFFLFVILSWVWPPNSPWAPWWRTNKKTARAICRLAKIGRKDIVYDLGCGDGTAILIASKEFGAYAVGIEIDPMRCFFARIRVLLNGLATKIVVKRKNFFDEDLSKATVVNIYLVPKTLNMLLPKMKKECKKGTRVVSFRYEIQKLKPAKYDRENDLRMYILG